MSHRLDRCLLDLRIINIVITSTRVSTARAAPSGVVNRLHRGRERGVSL